MSARFYCACEHGDNCTKTTMCAIDSAVEDQKGEYEQIIAELEGIGQRALEQNQRLLNQIDRLLTLAEKEKKG